MFSGSTIGALKRFDAWFGAHQKIDRVARRHLAEVIDSSGFPTIKQILRFEGLDGPDGIKRKTPAVDEPWHYYNPYDRADDRLVNIIDTHFQGLVRSIKDGNRTRSAFEAAWLAHAIVDGLTPAHHYPYEAELVKLRSGQPIATRTTVKEKLIMHGDTLPKRLGNNWKMWGDKGLMATHFAFEWGVAATIVPLKLGQARPSKGELDWVRRRGMAYVFIARAQEIAALNMYGRFYKSAWTPSLAKEVRQELVPRIVNTVTLAWYSAATEGGA